MPVRLFYAIESPPCRAVLIAAEAIGLQLELKTIDLSKGEHKTEEYIKLNPNHTIPTLEDDGVIIVDSHAILTYLVSKFGKDDSLYPKDLAKRALVDSRLHFDSGVAFSILKISYKAHIYDGQTEYLTKWQSQKIQEVYDFLNIYLAQSKWIAGDSVTVADISLVPTISSLDVMLAIDDSKYPNVRKWLSAASLLPYFEVNKKPVEEFGDVWKAISKH